MSHTYTSCLIHCVFSTKERKKTISPEIQERLWPYISGIAQGNGFKALEIGGVEDHVHILLSLPPTQSVSKCMQIVKGSSSKWIHETFRNNSIEWQEGYGAFSVSISQLDETVKYIRFQREHHEKRTFQEEYLSFLKVHSIPYDERYVF